MANILWFLLPKAIAAFYIWDAVKNYRRALRRSRVEAYHYWWLGVVLYSAATYVTWGWLLQLQWDLLWFCLGGFLVSMVTSMYMDRQNARKRKARMAGLDAEVEAFAADIAKKTEECNEILAAKHGIEAQISQLGKEQNEIISALDLTLSWQALPSEEFVARQSEIKASLLSMEKRTL